MASPSVNFADQPNKVPTASDNRTAGANKSKSSPTPQELEKITVEGEALDQSGYFDHTQSSTTITREAMERRQSSNVMEVLQDIPGVSIEGGPRIGGMKINIRGFDSNEDVLIKIDGATQNFEKYRYGIGLSIDPDLLKRIEVSRGSATLTRGSGALGGVIEMETIDARDLLRPDETWGFKAKYGHRFNNDSDQLTLTGMARPTDFLDFLVSGVKRETNNYKLPDGTRYPDSEETQLSGLAKMEIYNDFSETSFGYRFSNESGLEPFDATGGGPGVGGTVRRTTKEKSYTFNSRINPESDWLNISASLGYTDKNLKDEDSTIAGSLNDGFGTDIFQYNIWTAELRNESTFEIFNYNNTFTVGTQFNQEARTSTRINDGGTKPNSNQPSGIKESYGVFFDYKVYIGDLTLGAAIRGDYYEVKSADLAKQLLQAQGRETTSDFYQITPSFSINYAVLGGPVTLFYNYSEAFRAPLIDEYFSTGGFTRCRTFSRFKPVPTNFNTWKAETGSNSFSEFQAAKAAAEQDPHSQNNALCGSLYEPEESQNHEVGISFAYDGLFDESDRFSSKLTYFYIHVDNILESMYQNTVTGEISQPGEEVHHGFEVEIRYDSDTYFGSLALSTLDGYRSLNYFENNSNPLVAEHTSPADRGKADLVNSPADKLVFTIGRKFPQFNLDIGYRLEAFNDRLVTTGTKEGCPGGNFVVPSCNEVGTQKGYILHDLFVTWKPWERTVLRLSLDNFTNTKYSLPGFGGGEGVTAPGMDIRINFAQQF